jgi:hypothetical protein
MDRSREKQAIEAKLARCRELAKEFPHEPTARMIRDLEAELRQQLRQMEKSKANAAQLELGIGTAVILLCLSRSQLPFGPWSPRACLHSALRP